MTPSSSSHPAAEDKQPAAASEGVPDRSPVAPIDNESEQSPLVHADDAPGQFPVAHTGHASEQFPIAHADHSSGQSHAGKLPVVSGIFAEPLDFVELLKQAHHPGAGAVVLFSGEVRDNNRGRAVAYLEYESYGPLASKMIGEILQEAKQKWSLQIAIARHRVGKVAIGETAVIVITASAHRSEAYAANQYIIDRIKHEAPIWKCEYFADGTQEWGDNKKPLIIR